MFKMFSNKSVFASVSGLMVRSMENADKDVFRREAERTTGEGYCQFVREMSL